MALLNDNTAIFYRNFTAVTTAVGLSLLLIWSLFQDTGNLVSRENVNAIVTEVQLSSEFTNSGVLNLKLDDNKKIKIYVNINPFPTVGDVMPIILEKYDNDKIMYAVDHKKWFDEQIFK